jgi:hypothetical protein
MVRQLAGPLTTPDMAFYDEHTKEEEEKVKASG